MSSWHERRHRCEFRGIGFYLESNTDAGGKRLSVHEYPYSSKPFIEDMGNTPAKFKLNGFVIGADFDYQQDKLQAALDATGPGTLVHPHHGRVDVFVEEYNISYSTKDGGMAQFEISFIKAESKPLPIAGANTQAIAINAANELEQQAVKDFAKNWDKDLSPLSLQNIAKNVGELLSDVEEISAEMVDSALRLAHAPSDMAIAIIGTINRVTAKFKQPAYALGTYEKLFGSKGRFAIPNVSLTRQTKEAQASAVLFKLLAQAVLATVARAAVVFDYPAKDVALNVMRVINASVDALQINTSTDAEYYRLADMRGAVMKDLAERAAKLPQIDSVLNTITRPALVAAYELCGSITKEQELIERNNISNPNFVPQGYLEVLKIA